MEIVMRQCFVGRCVLVLVELTWVSGSVKPDLCGQDEPAVMFLTEQGLAQARVASSSLVAFIIQQLLLHPVAAAIVPLGFFPGFLIFTLGLLPEVVEVEGGPSL